jgi:ankyrin repeat protein
MERPDFDEDLPIAQLLEDNGREDPDDDVIAAHLLQYRNALQGTSFLYGMVQDQDTTCSAILGGMGCTAIVERVQQFPDDSSYTDVRTGRTPLHEACLRCSCIHVVSAILASNAGRALVLDNTGNTPLHLLFVGVSTHALEAPAMCAVIDELLADNESVVASVNNRGGNTPLHVAMQAAEAFIPFECFRRILQANPSSATRVNNLNQTPLSLHCQRRQGSKEVAELLLEAFPDAIRVLDTAKGWSPLHYAAENANHDLIKLLLHANAEAASVRTTPSMETPLHLLCRKSIGERHIPSIQSLVEADSRTVCARDAKKSLTPLHLACKNARVPENVIECLLEGCPEAASVPDSNNYLPIHHACEAGASAEVVSCLLQVYPAGANAKTKKNDTPLSLACACNKSTETVALLIQANSCALMEKNHYGFVPLHCVCGAVQPRMGIVEEVLRVCPRSVATKSHGGETPMHIACGNPSTCMGVIELLTTQYESNTDGAAEVVLMKNRQMTNKIGNTPCKRMI